MIGKISSDDSTLTNVDQKRVERVSPVQGVLPTRNHPEYGNNLPANTANSEHNVGQQATESEKIDEALREINKNIQVVQRELHFSVDEESGQTVIKVMNIATKEVIRQIPNEDALNFARRLGEGVDLKLFNEYT